MLAWGSHYLGREGQTYTTSSWVTCLRLDALDGQTLQQKTTDQGKRIPNCSISRGRRVVENTLEILVKGFRVLLGTMEQRPMVVRDIVFTCVVLYNTLRTQQGGEDRTPTPGNDVVAQQNEQVMYVLNENYRNLSREAKHQRELFRTTISPFQD